MSHASDRQKLLRGTTANDGTGDTLRAAADKINTNFKTLFETAFGDSVSAHDLFHVNSAGSIVFGDSAANTTTLVGDVASSSNKTITLPNHTGTLLTDSATQTLENKTLTTPKIGVVHDSNGDEVLLLSGENTANYIEVKSGDSNSGPAIAVAGDSADVDLRLMPLNSGVVRSTKPIVMGNETITAAGAVDPDVPITLITSSSDITLTCSDGTNIGQTKKFVTTAAGGATITPSNFGAGTSVFVDGFRGVELMWVGTNWIPLGFDSTSQTRIIA